MEEKYFSCSKVTGKVQKIIAPKTAEALELFCEQSREFTQAVEQSDKTFQDCLDSIAKGINRNGGVSDFEVFKAAAEFYFKGAEIHFEMKIDLGEDETPVAVSFDDLLDF